VIMYILLLLVRYPIITITTFTDSICTARDNIDIPY
jgi:hypothetical protein